jgi:hypothetical protein
VSLDDLKNDSEFQEIVEDMREECGKYGKEMLASYSFASMTLALFSMLLKAPSVS